MSWVGTKANYHLEIEIKIRVQFSRVLALLVTI